MITLLVITLRGFNIIFHNRSQSNGCNAASARKDPKRTGMCYLLGNSTKKRSCFLLFGTSLDLLGML
jgi:hypothetical protein